MKLKNKQQLSTLLKTIALTGLDGKGKKISIFSEVVIRFYKDSRVFTYGFMRPYGLFFRCMTEMDMEIDEEFTLSIPYIDVWIKFIDEIPGDEIIIDKDGGKLVITSDDGNSFYEINEYDPTSIITYTDKPVMIAKDDGFYSNLTDTLYDTYTTISFNPKKLLKAINPGKLISQLLVEMTIKEDYIGLSVGRLGGGHYAKHTTLEVPGVEIEEWEHEGAQTWTNSSGLHSIISAIADADSCDPRMYFIDSSKVLIIDALTARYNKIITMDLMFVITPSSKDSNSTQEEDEE